MDLIEIEASRITNSSKPGWHSAGSKSYNPIGKENEYKEIKGNDYFELLKFLISNGYIDET